MLRRIGLLNFKCFERLDLRSAPLNLLCGLNGMGKSSVIQALLVLRQSFRTGGLLEGRLILGGTLTDLGAGSEVVFEGKDDALVGFVLFGDPAVVEAPWAWAFEHTKAGDQLAALARDKVERILLAEGSRTATSALVCRTCSPWCLVCSRRRVRSAWSRTPRRTCTRADRRSWRNSPFGLRAPVYRSSSKPTATTS